MSNEQLYIMVGALVLSNATLLFFIGRMLDATNKRIDDLRDVLRAEMKATTAELKAEIKESFRLIK